MKADEALTHLAAYREGKAADPRLTKALRCIEKQEAHQGRLAEQVAFDVSVMEMLGAIRSPEDLRHRLLVAQPAGTKAATRPRHHITAVLAVALGVAIIVTVLVFLHMDSRRNFPGRESLIKIASAAKNMSGAELEPVANRAGELGDWFYMRGFEGYRLPVELRGAPAVLARTFRLENHPVAQIAIDLEPHRSLVYVLRTEDFGVALPNGDDWTVFSAQDWAAAARPFESSIAMITFRGSEAEMREFVASLKP